MLIHQDTLYGSAACRTRKKKIALLPLLAAASLCACAARTPGGQDVPAATSAQSPEPSAVAENPGQLPASPQTDTVPESPARDSESILPEEDRAAYEVFLQAVYAGSDYLYAYHDYDLDGIQELYVRQTQSSTPGKTPYGRILEYQMGGIAFIESGSVSEQDMADLNWTGIALSGTMQNQAEMTHTGIYAYISQNPQTQFFWYPEEETFLRQYGFEGSHPFYEYFTPEGRLQLSFYYDEELQSGCGLRYYERDPSDMSTSGTYGFSFQGLTRELNRDGLAVDYTKYEAVDGTCASSYEGAREKTEYNEAGQPSHYEANVPWEAYEGEEDMQLLLWMDYEYHPDGKLARRSYYHNPQIFGTWYTSWDSYFDASGRLEYESIYVTHGWMDYYYLYTDESVQPAYCLYLDDNLGSWIPELISYR